MKATLEYLDPQDRMDLSMHHNSIPNNQDKIPIHYIIFSSQKPFRKLMEFKKLFNAKLNMVMINTPNSFKPSHIAEEIMTNFAKEFEIENYTLNIYNDTNVENGILNFAKKTNADLIGIFTHGRTGLAHFFNGSISEDLVNHTTKPVVTFKI